MTPLRITYVIRTVDASDGAFRFATNLRPGFSPTVTRDVRHAKRYVRKSNAERALAAFVEARGSDRDGFEIVQDALDDTTVVDSTRGRD